MRQLYEDTASDSRLRLVLDNHDRRYSPENASGPLGDKVRPYVPVRVQSHDGTTTRTHWVGWIETIEPDVNVYGQRRVTITAAGPMLFFKNAETDIDLQINQRTDAIVDTLLSEVTIPPPMNVAWYLHSDADDPNAPSPLGTWYRLGQNTLLAETATPRALDAGVVTLALAADNWVNRERDKDTQFNVYRAIADVVAAERGRFYFDRAGIAVFWNRNHLHTGMTPSLTVSDDMVEMKYTYANTDSSFRNDIRVTCHPRSLSVETNKVLWSLDQQIVVAAGKTVRMTVAYRDLEQSELRVGGLDVYHSDLTLASGTVGVTVRAWANRARLIFRNDDPNTDAVITGLKLRGRKISDYGQMEATSTHTASLALYGQRSLSINLLSVENLEYAQKIADYERDRRALPRGLVHQVVLKSHAKQGGALHAHQLRYTVGDVIQVYETQTQHQSVYVVMGEQHKLSASATLLETTWFLEPLPPSAFPS
jgi:hypothetical protein